MLSYQTVQQESFLVGGQDSASFPEKVKSRKTSKLSKPSKLSAVASEALSLAQSFPAAHLYGQILRQPKKPDGSPLGCPCGRIYVLPQQDGNFMMADKDITVVGDPRFIVARDQPLRALRAHFATYGCNLHRLPLVSFADPSPEPLSCPCRRVVAIQASLTAPCYFVDVTSRARVLTLGEPCTLGRSRRLMTERGCRLHVASAKLASVRSI